MARRSQPYRLSWPLTSSQLENIDEMFQLLFDDTQNGTLDIRASQIRSGTLAVARGGTGLSTYTIGDLLYADGLQSLAVLNDIAAGSYLRSGGVATAPVWSTLTLPNAATTGDLLYASAANTISALADVAAGAYLRSGGVSTAPVWSSVTLPNAAAIGDLWYASTTADMTALADVSAGSYLRSGGVNTAPVWSTVKIPNTATTGDLWYASASNTLSALADVSAGSYLRSGGVSTAPVWSTVKIPNAASAGDLWQGTAASTISALASVAAGSYLRSAGVTTANVWSTLTLPNASAQGDLFYSTAANVMTVLAKNASATRYLSNTGTSNDPAWAQIALATGVSGNLPVANLGNGTFTKITSTSTGTQNDWAPGIAGNTFCEWSGASDATITGLATGTSGLVFIFKNTGSKVAYFPNADAGSSAANRFTNAVTSGATPVAPKGYLTYIHDGTDWKFTGHEQGDWITPTFSASNFTGNGAMTVTVDSSDVISYASRLSGTTLEVNVFLQVITIGGTPNTQVLTVIPGGFSNKKALQLLGFAINNGGAQTVCLVNITAGATQIGCLRDVVGTNWSAATDASYVIFLIHFEVT